VWSLDQTTVVVGASPVGGGGALVLVLCTVGSENLTQAKFVPKFWLLCVHRQTHGNGFIISVLSTIMIAM